MIMSYTDKMKEGGFEKNTDKKEVDDQQVYKILYPVVSFKLPRFVFVYNSHHNAANQKIGHQNDV
jgi:hypothetical protein